MHTTVFQIPRPLKILMRFSFRIDFSMLCSVSQQEATFSCMNLHKRIRSLETKTKILCNMRKFELYWSNEIFGNRQPNLQSERTLINGILLPKLFWPTMRKNVLVIKKNFWNSKLKAENLKLFWDHYRTIYSNRTIFDNRMLS